MLHTRLGLAIIALCTSGACDLVVGPGQTTVLGNRGSVFAVETPNAVSVQPGGTLVVEDADVFGRGRVVELGDFPQPLASEAIVSSGGTVRVLRGTIAGGNVVILPQDPNTPPPLPPMTPNPFGNPVPLASALTATDSVVEIEGGTLITSGSSGLALRFGVSGGTAVVITDSQLRIRGGALGAGPVAGVPLGAGNALFAARSDVEISGGTFEAGVTLDDSQSLITGGTFLQGLTLGLEGPSCGEIRGGSFRSLGARGRSGQVFIFGTNFNLPLGPVSPFMFFATPLSVRLTGMLADGSPLDVSLGADDGFRVVLASPDMPGCLP